MDSRGKADSPTLHVTNPFGPEGYFVKPGQHLLFVGGSLLKVIDTETTNCGCPAPEAAPAPVKVAEGGPVSPTEAAAQHPFPEAQSAGLAPGPETPQAPIGVVHTQVTTAFSVKGDAPKPTPEPQSAAPVTPAQPAIPVKKPNAFVRFFKRLFGGH